tara:strand:+ start:8767 stop:11097 length:2331 start_codon:yes stop_codon:yes gene_type:complete
MSKLEKAYKNATSLKINAKQQLNSERDFFNKKDRQLEGYIEDKTKYGYNKLQQYKPEVGDKNNPIAKLIKIFEETLSRGEPLLSKFSNFYLAKGDLLHYIPRTILLFLSIFIIITEVILLLISPVIEAIPFIGPPLLKLLQFFSLPKELYFMFYGGIKFVLCFTILLSVIILIKEREKYFSASMKDILFLFIVFVINLLPYLYDLLSYIIHLGIMDGFYRYKCQRDSEDNEKVIANKFNLITILEYGILLIGLISFLYYFLRHYFYPNVKKDDQKNPWYIESLPLFMFFVPILYLGILYICNFIEKELSDMVLTNMGSMDEDIPDEKNCVAGPGQCEDSDDNKLTGLLKLFIYGGISFFIVILQRTSLSKTIRNVLEQTITTNIMLIQKIIGINIKVKNYKGEYEDFDVGLEEKKRNISDYSYGKEIGKKLEKINVNELLRLSSSETLSVKDCENISNLRDIYNSLKKQHELYNDSSPNYNQEKFEKIKSYTDIFKTKINTIKDIQLSTDNIFDKDIFDNEKLKNLIENCSRRMKELDPNSTFGLNAEYERIKSDIKNNEKEKSLLTKVLNDKYSEQKSFQQALKEAEESNNDDELIKKLKKRITEIPNEITRLKKRLTNLNYSAKSFEEKQNSLEPLAETIQSKNNFDRETAKYKLNEGEINTLQGKVTEAIHNNNEAQVLNEEKRKDTKDKLDRARSALSERSKFSVIQSDVKSAKRSYDDTRIKLKEQRDKINEEQTRAATKVQSLARAKAARGEARVRADAKEGELAAARAE